MIKNNKGFNIMDADDLFQFLYNPFFTEWKDKSAYFNNILLKKKQISKIINRNKLGRFLSDSKNKMLISSG